ncbi:MAG: CHAT domain-containing protein [Actinomycetota bacterium]
MEYEAFEVIIRGTWADGFTVQAERGTKGSSRSETLDLGMSASDLEADVVGLAQAAAGDTNPWVDGELRAFGERLYKAVFTGAVGRALAQAGTGGVRIRLRVEAVELADVPWELLYDEVAGKYLSLSKETPVVRTVEGLSPSRPLAVDEVNVLVMVAGRGGDDLETQKEFDALRDRFDADDDISMTRCEAATIESLQDALGDGTYHVFHFIGHGAYNEVHDSGALLLDGPDGGVVEIPVRDLTRHLGDHPSLRLVVLNACEGARTSVTNPNAGVAQALVRDGVAVVIAMQFAITDAAAGQFSTTLYRQLSRRNPVEEAVAEARKSITGPGAEWATPVLLMRSHDGRLLAPKAASSTVASVPSPQPKQEPVPSPEPVGVTPEPEPAVVPAAPPHATADTSATSGGGSTRRVLLGIVALVVAAIIAAVFVLGGGGSDDTRTADADPITADADPTTADVVDDTPLGPDESFWFDLVVGDCVDLLNPATFDGRFTLTSCSGSASEVIAVVDLRPEVGDAYPADAELDAAVDRVCTTALQESGFDTTFFDLVDIDRVHAEDAVEWAQSTSVVCILFEPYG